MFKKLLLPIGLLSSLVSTALAGPSIVPVTTTSGVKSFLPTDILQIVGAFTDTGGTQSNLKITFQDGTVIENLIPARYIASGAASERYTTSNPVQGMTLTGVTSMQVNHGNSAVMVKVMKTAAEFVSEPVMLPVVDDGTYTITLETSVDMQNWAPAAPGDYLGSTSHRFFRVRAEKKDGPVAGE